MKPKSLGEHKVPIISVVTFEILWIFSTVGILERAGWIRIDYWNLVKGGVYELLVRNVRSIFYLIVYLVENFWDLFFYILNFIIRTDFSTVDITIFHVVMLMAYMMGSVYSQEYFHLSKYLDSTKEFGSYNIEEKFRKYREVGGGNTYFKIKALLTILVIVIFYHYVIYGRWDIFSYTAYSIPIIIISFLAFFLIGWRRKSARIKVVNLHSGYLWGKKWIGDDLMMPVNPELANTFKRVNINDINEDRQPTYKEHLPVGGYFLFSATDSGFLQYVNSKGQTCMVESLDAARIWWHREMEKGYITSKSFAKEGDESAIAYIGLCLFFGYGVDQNIPDAIHYTDLAIYKKSSYGALYKAQAVLFIPGVGDEEEAIYNVVISFYMDKPNALFDIPIFQFKRLSSVFEKCRDGLQNKEVLAKLEIEFEGHPEETESAIEQFIHMDRSVQ